MSLISKHTFVIVQDNLKNTENLIFSKVDFFFEEMATLRIKRKLTVVSKETHGHPRNSRWQNTSVPGFTEEYMTKVSEELSQEFNRTESLYLGALSMLDEFLLNPQVRTLSGTVRGKSRNNDLENREPTGDRSQSDPHPEVEFSDCPSGNSIDSNPEETSYTHCFLSPSGNRKRRTVLSYEESHTVKIF